MSDWNRAKREVNSGARFGLGWIIVIVAIILAISAAVWGITVLVSGPRGQGDAIIEKNSAANWTAAQARFEDNYQEVKATDKNIAVTATALALDPENKTLQTNFLGLQNYCNTVVADYNADARKFLSEDFRAADLPQEIDSFDPTTDCK